MKKFYMVFNEGGGVPTVKHDSYESASQEAERLAIKTGGVFHVLESVSSVEKSITKWTVHG